MGRHTLRGCPVTLFGPHNSQEFTTSNCYSQDELRRINSGPRGNNLSTTKQSRRKGGLSPLGIRQCTHRHNCITSIHYLMRRSSILRRGFHITTRVSRSFLYGGTSGNFGSSVTYFLGCFILGLTGFFYSFVVTSLIQRYGHFFRVSRWLYV